AWRRTRRTLPRACKTQGCGISLLFRPRAQHGRAARRHAGIAARRHQFEESRRGLPRIAAYLAALRNSALARHAQASEKSKKLNYVPTPTNQSALAATGFVSSGENSSGSVGASSSRLRNAMDFPRALSRSCRPTFKLLGASCVSGNPSKKNVIESGFVSTRNLARGTTPA